MKTDWSWSDPLQLDAGVFIKTGQLRSTDEGLALVQNRRSFLPTVPKVPAWKFRKFEAYPEEKVALHRRAPRETIARSMGCWGAGTACVSRQGRNDKAKRSTHDDRQPEYTRNDAKMSSPGVIQLPHGNKNNNETFLELDSGEASWKGVDLVKLWIAKEAFSSLPEPGPSKLRLTSTCFSFYAIMTALSPSTSVGGCPRLAHPCTWRSSWNATKCPRQLWSLVDTALRRRRKTPWATEKWLHCMELK